jgi:LAS superfamily LD-carboxypeptidase LdcB
LAVDLWDASTNYDWQTSKKLQKYYKWLNENAHNFGFHNTYQK